MISDRTKLLTKYLLVITLQSESCGLLLFSPYNFPLKMVSFYLIFCTAKWDGVFDQPFYDTFLKMSSCIAFSYCSKLFWILSQTNLFLFHYATTVDFYLWQLVSATRTVPVLISVQEMEWREYTTQLCFHRIQSVKLCWFTLAEVLDDYLWNKLSPWSERFQAYYFTWVVSPVNDPSLSVFEVLV